MSDLHPEPGLRVADRYQLTSRIAVGGMGEVWRAQDEILGREVAVKLLRREFAQDEMFLTRFRAEARHTASLSHPGIASVYDYGETLGTAYLVMELVDGEPLSAWLSRQGALPAATAVPLIQQAAAGLQAAHDGGVVHRDIKPANLLITHDETLKITDFGIARAGDQVPITRTGEVMGTAQYLSPEQAIGQPATPLSDVYALGVVAYETLAGRRPFDHGTAVATAMAQVNDAPDPLPPDVPASVAAVVLWAMEKDPAHRPQSAAELGQALGGAMQGVDTAPSGTQVMPAVVAPVPVTGPPTTVTAASGPVPADHRTRNVLLAVLGVLLVAALVALAVHQLGDDTTNPTPGTTATTSAPTTSAPTTSQTTSSPDEITLDPADYVGRPAKDVERELKAMGLEVTQNPVKDTGAEQNTVVALSPTSGLQEGDTVTLDVAKGKSEPTNTPTTSTTSTTTTTTTTTTTPETPATSPTGDAAGTADATGDPGDPISTEAAG
ncbi:protein kinase domain-containing protein [Angustibacter luteus]|uniref:non-specific serine/threonine protein kinase n=1 Tax=Angustibacter luteus TaxID=658456 RepID=A0ABW1JEN6_9ACTN